MPSPSRPARRITTIPGSTPAPTRGDPQRRDGLSVGPALRARQANALAARLAPQLDGRLILSMTDNRAVMISVRRDLAHHEHRVRIHHLFANAPDAIVHALARYIQLDDPQASRQLGDYIDTHDHRIRDDAPPSRTPILRTAGRVYDLAAVADQLNQRYFGGRASCGITWGRNARRGVARHSVRLGSWCMEEDLIRIHPGLDQAWVPRYYLEWVVYHEMLHAQRPIRLVNGRHVFHDAEFSAEERSYEHYERAAAWERSHVAALLRI